MIEAGHPLIQIQDLTKVFYTDEIETHALSGIHLSVNKGEYVAMSGPSGCGKSTLLSIIGLLDTPTAGRYSLNGKTVENLDFAERSRIRNQEIGFIFQSFNLIGDLTVYENVELPLTYRQRMPAADRKSRVMEALERVGMAHRIRHYPSIEQMLINLMRNAVEAALEPRSGDAGPTNSETEVDYREPQVTLSWALEDHSVEITIDDNGLGLLNPSNAFVPFYTTKPSGSGIGLALSRQIVEAHGGSIELSNLNGKRGCRVQVKLPRS